MVKVRTDEVNSIIQTEDKGVESSQKTRGLDGMTDEVREVCR